MRDWNLTLGDPLSLHLAADARQTVPNYIDDQIWYLSLGEGDPPALAMETTYGRRAQRMRIFPGFSLEGGVLINPDQFSQGVAIRRVYPNYVRLLCQPFERLDTQIEYWVRESNLLQGRFLLTNRSADAISMGLRLYAHLRIGEQGEPMGEWQFKGVTCLAGKVVDLAPIVFITGGGSVDLSIYPSLIVNLDLEAGSSKSIYWAHAGNEDHVTSFESARSAVAIPWDSQLANLELQNQSMVQIETGDPDWDAAFLFAQNTTVGAYLGPTKFLPQPSFVLSRTENHGYSPSGDGSDYGPSWEGQAALPAYLHLPLILTIEPELAKGVLRNFLSVQTPFGFIDWKPGLGGQRNGSLSLPLLSSMVWMTYQQTQDRTFVEETFDGLSSFIDAWFDEEHDRDKDGFPEWDHLLQMGYDDCPAFSPWKEWGQGLDVSVAESPDLAAYLVSECRALIEMAELLGREEPIESLNEHIGRLIEALKNAWDEEASIYRYVDRDTHIALQGELLGSGRGEFVLQLDREFTHPVRILIRSHGEEVLSHAEEVYIHGREKGGKHRVERLRKRDFSWYWGIGTVTSGKTYIEIERIEVKGIGDEFDSEIWIADFTREDAGLILPLWAGIPDQDSAERMIEKALLDEDRFYRANGIANISALDPAYDQARDDGAGGVEIVRNVMLAEGLLKYGYLQEAADLVGRLMDSVMATLKRDGGFRERYDPDEARALGEKNHLEGLPPLDLFLKTLGVRLYSQDKVSVRGTNPFPWPVKIRWKGVEIECLDESAMVRFPDGSMIEITGKDRQLVERVPGSQVEKAN